MVLSPSFVCILPKRFERISGEIADRVEQSHFHSGNTMELRIEKPSFQYMPGQYLFLNIPSISAFQWHPFTISSSPEEGFVSIHIRIVGDWTKNAAKMLGCYEQDIEKRMDLPEIRIDGPYGAPAEDLYNYKVAVLVGAGIGVTPAASLLKSYLVPILS
ncbi:hypothetical protein BSLG_005940 [Batrachochytrium salamandrivorans]|nr:hypothetical protein BSLG_005940 [Batrachochytrium salamandrivorans]